MLPFTYALRNLFRDPARLLQTVGGSALVVLLLITAVAMNRGMDSVLSSSGSPRNVILMGKGSEESLERSEVSIDAESAAATSIDGIVTKLGVAAISGEITYQAPIRTSSGKEEPALLRGVLEKALLVHTSVRLLEGTFPGPGEVMVGDLTHRKLGVEKAELGVGKQLFLNNWFLIVSLKYMTLLKPRILFLSTLTIINLFLNL